MNRTICRIGIAGLLGMLAGWGTGCVHPRIVGMDIREPAHATVSTSPSRRAGRGESPASVAETGAARALRVRVGVECAQGTETLGRALRSRVEGALAGEGFALAGEGRPAELAVDVSVKAERLNQRGSRVVWKGDADARVSRAPAGVPEGAATIARTWREVKGSEARGDEAAQKGLAERLAPEVAAFAAESAEKAAAGLRAVEVEARNAWGRPDEAAAYAAKFAQTVQGMTGVYRCVVLETKAAERRLLADVLYDGELVPEGIGNRIAREESLGFGRRQEPAGLRVAQVTVRDGWKKPRAEDAAAYAAQFVKVVSQMPGVYGCRILDTNAEGQTLTAEVVFDESAMPEGFENRLLLQDGLGFPKR